MEALNLKSPTVAVALVTTAITPPYCLGVVLALVSPRGRALVADSPVLVLAVAIGVVAGVVVVTGVRCLSAQPATELAGRLQRAALRVLTGLVGPVGAGLLSLSPLALAMAGSLVVLTVGRGIASMCGKHEQDEGVPEEEQGRAQPTLKCAAGDEKPEETPVETKPPTMSEEAFKRVEDALSAIDAVGDTMEIVRVDFDSRLLHRSNSSTGLLAMFAPPTSTTALETDDDGIV